jgi:hypothetical protein
VALDRVGKLGPVPGVELGGLIDEDHGARINLDRAFVEPDFELLDGERGAVPPSCSAIRREVVPSIAHAITRHSAAR